MSSSDNSACGNSSATKIDEIPDNELKLGEVTIFDYNNYKYLFK